MKRRVVVTGMGVVSPIGTVLDDGLMIGRRRVHQLVGQWEFAYYVCVRPRASWRLRNARDDVDWAHRQRRLSLSRQLGGVGTAVGYVSRTGSGWSAGSACVAPVRTLLRSGSFSPRRSLAVTAAGLRRVGACLRFVPSNHQIGQSSPIAG
jgi:hypothetical protein